MEIGTLLLLALVLVCPLTMYWMMRGHRKGDTGGKGHKHRAAASRTGHTEPLERHEPPYTKSDGIVAPKFGAAGSGGAEYERGPEMHDR